MYTCTEFPRHYGNSQAAMETEYFLQIVTAPAAPADSHWGRVVKPEFPSQTTQANVLYFSRYLVAGPPGVGVGICH